MVFFNHATRQMTAKIVYYGPGLCGKTTNLNTIYGKTSQKARGEMVSLNTETDRTLFFDLLPMDVGMVGGFKTKLQLYTVPGQVFYNSTRKLVLKGVDGIVFVVDSQTPMLDACKDSYKNLEENLRELGLTLQDIPMVFQWNKRDLRNVVPVEELEAALNPRGIPSFQSVASDGTGVFETLRGITKLALFHIKTHVMGDAQVPAAQAAPAAPVAPAPAPPLAPTPARTSAPEPSRSAGEALTLSDLPSVHDLLEMEEAGLGASMGSNPLPDEDDTGFYIEAPMLPEHPGAGDDDLAFLTDDGDEDMPPPAAFVEAEPLPVLPTHVPEPPKPAPPVVPKPVVPAPSVKVQAPSPSKPAVKADPLAALTSMKLEAMRPAAKPKTIDHKDAINSLMGELTQVGRLGAPSVLRLDVPGDLDGHEIEVVVQLRRQGQILVEGQILRPLPGKGSTTKLNVELKRS